jgi:hypothetical protein
MILTLDEWSRKRICREEKLKGRNVETDNEFRVVDTMERWDGDELWLVVSTKGSQWTVIDSNQGGLE